MFCVLLTEITENCYSFLHSDLARNKFRLLSCEENLCSRERKDRRREESHGKMEFIKDEFRTKCSKII